MSDNDNNGGSDFAIFIGKAFYATVVASIASLVITFVLGFLTLIFFDSFDSRTTYLSAFVVAFLYVFVNADDLI